MYQFFRRTKLVVSNSKTVFQTANARASDSSKFAKLYKELLLSSISMPGKDTRTLNLDIKILEAYTRDVGRGVARLDYDSMDSLGASTGDVIELKGGEKSRSVRRTVAKCLPCSARGRTIYR